MSSGITDAAVDAAARIDDTETDRDDELRHQTTSRGAFGVRQGCESVGRRFRAECGLSPVRRVEFGMDVHSVSSFPDE
jgi:hypothetical protein